MGKLHSFEFIKQEFLKRGFNILSTKYINAITKLKYKCDKGHINFISYNKLQQGRGCPDCNALKMFGNNYGFKHGLSKTKEYRSKNAKEYRKANPWLLNLKGAKARCTNHKHQSYKYYGAKGIRVKLTVKEVKKLWFRDKAYLMEHPSIDREDSNKNYTFDNCRFMELSDNVKRSRNNGR